MTLPGMRQGLDPSLIEAFLFASTTALDVGRTFSVNYSLSEEQQPGIFVAIGTGLDMDKVRTRKGAYTVMRIAVTNDQTADGVRWHVIEQGKIVRDGKAKTELQARAAAIKAIKEIELRSVLATK